MMVMIFAMTFPAWAVRKTLDPDAGKWTVEINAPAASVSISGLAQPFSSVQVTVHFIGPGNQSSDSRFPVNVMFLTKAKLTPQNDGVQVKSITLECTRGKVDIEAHPASGSGGASGDWW